MIENMTNQSKKNQGFTLVELAIVVIIFSILAAIIMPAWRSFSETVNLDDAIKMVETKTKLAKNYSLSSVNDTVYGIHFEAAKVTLFKGSAYNAVDPANVVYNLPNGISLYDISLAGGSGNDLVFDRLVGTTGNVGSIKIKITANPAKFKQIFINAQGQTGSGAFQTSAIQPIVEGLDSGSNAINSRHLHFNLSWSIQGSTTLRLEWIGTGVTTPVTENVSTAAYFNADKSVFSWQGGSTVDGIAQNLEIHTITLDAGTTLLCIMRDRTKNNKSLNIYFIDGGTKKIVNYTENADGTILVTPDGIYGGTMTAQ